MQRILPSCVRTILALSVASGFFVASAMAAEPDAKAGQKLSDRASLEKWQKEVIHVPTQGRRFTIWWEQEPILPLGVATWHTTGALREICLRKH